MAFQPMEDLLRRINSRAETSVFCDSRDEQAILMGLLVAEGYKWRSGRSLLDFSENGYGIGEFDVAAITYTIHRPVKHVTKATHEHGAPIIKSRGCLLMADYMPLPCITESDIDEILLI